MGLPFINVKESGFMNYVGDYFAFGLVIVLSLFFFDGKHALNKTSKSYVACLMFTALTAILDIVAGGMIEDPSTPVWLNMLVNTLFYLVNLLCTSSIALYLFYKILEHSHNKHCMRNAMVGLAICLGVHSFMIIGNLWTGWAFYFDENYRYCRGPLNAFGYFVTVAQMALVMVCYIRNRKNASKIMTRVLIRTFPVVLVCIFIQRHYPDIMLNSFIMAMMLTVLFLTFKGKQPGVHVLTRLNDRHSFFDRLDEHLQTNEPLQVFLINIKNFGTINQKYGHMFGDELLYQFAFSLERLIKGCGAYHMNGTVFALLIPNPDQHTAESNRSELLNFMETPIACIRERVQLEYVMVESFGMEKNMKAAELYELLEYAAGKAYINKSRYIRCSEDLSREMKRTRYLIERLRVIDREHGFRVWYQPIRSIVGGRFDSMEALIRLVEPDGTIISPGEFIPIAEKTGMVASLTWFVLEEACRMLKEHEELKDVSISINLPMAQMLEKGFILRMNSVLESYGLTHDRIGLEFTERDILENFDQVKYVMQQFTQSGYRFYLDDFGSGYSNFNCLLQLPFKHIKLDMTLIRMDVSNEGLERLGLVKTLSAYLHKMNLDVVAEGVETRQMAETLVQLGVDRIQGYYFARPMPEEKVIEFYNHKG